ncbi:2053_t:CDS:1 [Ambispora leptoticha]|uniref:2053_t:CDS:1 n=1 Tax=Ambispora leptoticha TaxID=144679 RepID=A0A9N8YW59_9GLOM|nr:2053_t:CDS:1 [Ambispora leptoticha]
MNDKSASTTVLPSKPITFVPSTQKFPQTISTSQEIDASIFEVTEEAKSTCEFYQDVISLPPINIANKMRKKSEHMGNTAPSPKLTKSLPKRCNLESERKKGNSLFTISYKNFVGVKKSRTTSQTPDKNINKESNFNSEEPCDSLNSNIFLSNTEDRDTWHCASCALDIPSQSFQQHLHGTAHLISHVPDDDAVPVDPLVLNESNIGFRILRGQGWTYEKGLGVSEQGRRQPITPKIKNDRLGIGLKSSTLKKQRELKQKKEKSKKMLNAKEIARQYEKEKKERINLLAYMNR